VRHIARVAEPRRHRRRGGIVTDSIKIFEKTSGKSHEIGDVSDRFPFADGAGPARPLVVFRLHGRLAAFASENVERITAMAELLLPPGLPAALEGVLNLAGVAVPVVSLNRLFRLPTREPGLYSMLIVLRLDAEARIAVWVERVTAVIQVAAMRLRPLDRDDFFNGCAEGVVELEGESVHLLSPARLLLAKERDALAEFGEIAQDRLREWQAVRA